MMMRTYQLYIDGKCCDASGGRLFDVLCPATSACLTFLAHFWAAAPRNPLKGQGWPYAGSKCVVTTLARYIAFLS